MADHLTSHDATIGRAGPPARPGVTGGAVRATKLEARDARIMLYFVLPCLIFMLGVFLYPIVNVIAQSLMTIDGVFTWAGYKDLLASRLFRKVLITTFEISFLATIVTVFFAYPVAYHLAKQPPRARAFYMVLVLLPFWTSILVKSFAFTVVLGTDGMPSFDEPLPLHTDREYAKAARAADPFDGDERELIGHEGCVCRDECHGGEESENLEVTHRILELTGADPSLVRHVEDRAGHDRRYALDDSKLRLLGWSPERSFGETGLAETVALCEGTGVKVTSQRVDVADLSRDVLEHAGYFGDVNHRVLDDDRAGARAVARGVGGTVPAVPRDAAGDQLVGRRADRNDGVLRCAAPHRGGSFFARPAAHERVVAGAEDLHPERRRRGGAVRPITHAGTRPTVKTTATSRKLSRNPIVYACAYTTRAR